MNVEKQEDNSSTPPTALEALRKYFAEELKKYEPGEKTPPKRVF